MTPAGPASQPLAPDAYLDSAPPGYLRALVQSLHWKIVASIGSLVFGAAGAVLLVMLTLSASLRAAVAFAVMPMLVGLGLGVVSCAVMHWIANLRFTVPDPRGVFHRDFEKYRRLFRAMLWIAMIAGLLLLAAAIAVVSIYERECLASPGAVKLSYILLGIGSIWGAFFLAIEMMYIRYLGERARDVWITTHAARLVWVLPLLALASGTGIAALAAVGLRLHLYFRLHKSLSIGADTAFAR